MCNGQHVLIWACTKRSEHWKASAKRSFNRYILFVCPDTHQPSSYLSCLALPLCLFWRMLIVRILHFGIWLFGCTFSKLVLNFNVFGQMDTQQYPLTLDTGKKIKGHLLVLLHRYYAFVTISANYKLICCSCCLCNLAFCFWLHSRYHFYFLPLDGIF